jgi:signal transduction histidine kinase/DNA-binding response OmpR family regulator
MKSRILLLGEAPVSQRIGKSRAVRLQCHVDRAADVEECEARLEASDYDILLVDVDVLGGDRLDGLDRLHRRARSCPLVVLGTEETLTPVLEERTDVVFDFLRKPLSSLALDVRLSRAIENQRHRQSTSLYRAGEAIFRSGDARTLPRVIVEIAMKVMEADDVSLMLPDEKGNFYIAHSRGLSQENWLAPREQGESVAGVVARRREPAILQDDVHEDERFPGIAPLEPWDPKRKVRSSIVYPLLAGERTVGVLNVNRVDSARPFRESDLLTAAVLGSQIVLALENARLYEETVRLAAFPKLSPYPMLELSASGDVLYVNPAVERLVKELSLPSPKDLLPDESDALIARCVETSRIEADIEKVTGTKTIAWSFIPAEPSAKVLAVGYDMTGHLELARQLQQAQKMEAIGRLAGGVAHDFNNLLTVIVGYSEVLLADGFEDDETVESLKEIHLAGQRAALLTRQLLSLSRQKSVDPRPLDLNAVVLDIERMLRRLIGEHIELSLDLEPGIGRINSDPGQISQVIMNLLLNARDAMPKGGRIFIETRNRPLQETWVRQQTVVPAGRYVSLFVSDTGAGMDKETLARVFEPFFTTKEVGQGTGLGLSTVYGIVRQADGHIWAYSEVGKGTTFKIYFPAADGVEESEEAGAVLNTRGHETILVVEDEDPIRRLAQRVLTQQGYRVLEARDGEEALAISKESTEAIDLLVTDIVMPKLDGFHLSRKLAGERPGVKVIFMSGYPDNVVSHYGLRAEDAPFLEKPFVPDVLLRTVRQTLDAPPRHGGDGE